MTDHEGQVGLRLSADEALVLSDLLYRWIDREHGQSIAALVEDDARRVVDDRVRRTQNARAVGGAHVPVVDGISVAGRPDAVNSWACPCGRPVAGAAVVVAVNVTVPPLATLINAPVMLPVPLAAGQLEPAVAAHVHVTADNEAGKPSVTAAPVTPSGPLLWTVMV